MKSRRFVLPIVLISAVVILTVYTIFNNEVVDAVSFALQPPPTPAPTRTAGPPARTTPKPIPTLAQPLDTELQVLTRALEIDSGVATWSKPWSLDTPRLEPARITVTWHPDRSFEGGQYSPDWFETGPVWAVTIKGNVSLNLPGGFGYNAVTTYDSVTYIIAQKTGSFLGWRTGQPINQPPTKVPTIQLPSAGTPDALTSLTVAACTQNPLGLSFRVTQQPGKAVIPGVGSIYSFLVEGTGFVPAEKVHVVIKARFTGPATIATTNETVKTDSTFATSVGVAVTQPSMPVDLFVIHRRGIACVNVTVKP